MYEALIKALRTCVDKDKDCSDCPYEEKCGADKTGRLVPMVDAAQALEDSIDFMPVVLCMDCKWWIPHGKETPASIPASGECRFKDRKFGTSCWEFCYWGEWKDDA